MEMRDTFWDPPQRQFLRLWFDKDSFVFGLGVVYLHDLQILQLQIGPFGAHFNGFAETRPPEDGAA